MKQAAERVQMSPTHWRKIENGEVDVTLNTLARLAEALEVDPAELLGPAPRRRST